jgi:predicted metal-dependent phosphoesterase TrpH
MERLRVEFHCHTIYSKDSLVTPRQLVDTARRIGIDRLIVTDHNRLGGAMEAKKLDPELIIPGEEILTTRGELLAAFVTEEIPAGLEPREVIRRLRAQEAFISVSHPLDRWRGWRREDLLEIIPFVDAIETFNARCMDPGFNDAAQDFARQHGLAGTVGSDAHTLRELGRATLTVERFSGARELGQVLCRGAVESTQLSSPWIHISSRYATTLKKIGLVNQP